MTIETAIHSCQLAGLTSPSPDGATRHRPLPEGPRGERLGLLLMFLAQDFEAA